MDFYRNRLSAIVALCMRHKVRKLYILGSLVTNHFNEQNNTELIADLKGVSLEDYSCFKDRS
ncbi:hypothetical protein LJC35_02285 [Parabacteroides sp. OttesenSCG-928-N08]|nr:hypothetical protein [Parabacteroides sp. OttesenSCG-928-N08]